MIECRFEVPLGRPAVSAFADDFDAWATQARVPAPVVMAFQVAFDEWLTNIADYGFPHGGGAPTRIRLWIDAGRLHAEVRDAGQPFNPLERVRPDTDAALDDREIGGLGIHLMRELMDDVAWRRDGDHNLLTLAKSLAGHR